MRVRDQKALLRQLGLGLLLWGLGCSKLWAGDVHVAVAANFTAAAREIVSAFEQASGERVLLSFGSTGKLFTQIANGAPYDVFLAADQVHPTRLVAAGHAVAESQFSYAQGRIVLYSRDPQRVDGEGQVLRDSDSFRKLAIANPKTAPYGRAALETLQALQLDQLLAAQLVRGDNIVQTYQFVATGNAELGFVALAQVIGREEGYWLVPPRLYTPLRQDAVLLQAGRRNPSAAAFLAFLRQPAAQAVIERYGYRLD
ncbi:MAG TPA: molybdate ABC transporter substrate-binding protein [Motiliproteus sp.]